MIFATTAMVSNNTNQLNWIHDFHKNELDTIDIQNIQMNLFLRSCEPFYKELRLHYMPVEEDDCYLVNAQVGEDDMNRFSEIIHGCHYKQVDSILENGLQCSQIMDNSPFRYKRERPEWNILNPAKNDGSVEVIWFGSNINDNRRPASRYGKILLREPLSNYTGSACSKCCNVDLSAEGNLNQQNHDGWHYFLCEFYKMRMEVETRFFVSREPQKPHCLAVLYYPGREGGPWHLTDKNTGASYAISYFNGLKHSAAFMIDEAPTLKTLHLSLSSNHNQQIGKYKYCLKKECKYGSGQLCPDERECGIDSPQSEGSMKAFREIGQQCSDLFRSIDIL